MKSITHWAVIALISAIYTHACADTAGYYFNFSNKLIDLPYPADTFYGEVVLDLQIPNNLSIDVNAFTAPTQLDYFGNTINSPLVPGSNFGIQLFAFDSTLVITEDDFNTFHTLYDVVVPENWDCKFNGQVSEFGRFEFVNQGTGNSRQDPLTISITPKVDADLTGYEFSSVMAFVQPNAAGYYFAAHIAGFTVDPAWWESGSTNPESANFAVGGLPLIIPEPSLMTFAGLLALMFLRFRKA